MPGLCRDVNPSQIRHWSSDRSFSFHLISVAPLDALAGVKELIFFLILKDLFV